jgi:hypothetical protein
MYLVPRLCLGTDFLADLLPQDQSPASVNTHSTQHLIIQVYMELMIQDSRELRLVIKKFKIT